MYSVLPALVSVVNAQRAGAQCLRILELSPPPTASYGRERFTKTCRRFRCGVGSGFAARGVAPVVSRHSARHVRASCPSQSQSRPSSARGTAFLGPLECLLTDTTLSEKLRPCWYPQEYTGGSPIQGILLIVRSGLEFSYIPTPLIEVGISTGPSQSLVGKHAWRKFEVPCITSFLIAGSLKRGY